MSLLSEIKKELESIGITPRKRFGQNFLINEGILNRIVDTADIKNNEGVIEVGPGTGILTKKLLEKGASVTSIEIDNDLSGLLRKKFENNKNFKLENVDALKFVPKTKDYKLIANIPYYITSPLISHFLESKNKPKKMVLLIQKEVAEKICAKEGKLNVLAIHVQVFGKPEIIKIVKEDNFYPAPKVESAVLNIEVFDKPLIENYKDVFEIMHKAFTLKRKKLSNSLPEHKETLIKLDLENQRPEKLSIKDWENINLNSG